MNQANFLYDQYHQDTNNLKYTYRIVLKSNLFRKEFEYL